MNHNRVHSYAWESNINRSSGQNRFVLKNYTEKHKKSEFFKYLLTFLLVGFTGIYIFSSSKLLLTVGFLLTSIMFWSLGKKIDKGFYLLILIIVVMTIVQGLSFSYVSINTILGTLIRFSFPYLALKLIGEDFIKYYVKIILVLSIISFLFYIPTLINPDFIDTVEKISRTLGTDKVSNQSIIIYNLERSSYHGIYRNAGFAWEPGAFSGFLIVALAFNFLQKGTIINWINIILFVTILTTFSTAGYLALIFLVMGFVTIRLKSKFKVFIIVLLGLVSYFTFVNLEFLNSKIESQIKMTETTVISKQNKGRFGSAMVDIKDIKKFPLFGRGRAEATRFDNSTSLTIMQKHRTNGITDFAVKYGLIITFLYFSNILRSLKGLCKTYDIEKAFSFVFFGIILINLFSQAITQSSFYIAIMFLFTIYPLTKNYYLISQG